MTAPVTDVCDFELLHGRAVPGAGHAFVLLATGTWTRDDPDERTCFAEVFLTVPPGGLEGLRWRRFTTSCSADAEQRTRRRLREVALSWVEGELDGYLLEWRQREAAGGPYPQPFDLKAVAEADLHALVVRDAFSVEVLERIKAASRCKTLRIYIKAVLELDEVLSDKFGS